MHKDFRTWLTEQGYVLSSRHTLASRVKRVERAYGPLDKVLENGKLDALVKELTYVAADRKNDRPNPSRIPFAGKMHGNLQSFKSAVLLYARFWESLNRPGKTRSVSK